MLTPEDERNVYFFMAYLAAHEQIWNYHVPLERSAFQLTSRADAHPESKNLHFLLGVTSELTVPVAIPFSPPLSPTDIKALADDLVADLDGLALNNHELADAVFELQEAASKAFASAKRKKAELKLSSLNFDLAASTSREPAFRLTFSKLGQDARPVEDSVLVQDAEDLEARIAGLIDEQTQLAERAREIANDQADGAIDAVLASRLERHGVPLARVVKTPQELRADCALELPDGEIRLFWKDGILTANMGLGTGLDWVGGAIKFGDCPSSLEGDLEGRLVSDFLQHEDLPDDLTVIAGRGRPGKTAVLQTGLPYLLFDTKADIMF